MNKNSPERYCNLVGASAAKPLLPPISELKSMSPSSHATYSCSRRWAPLPPYSGHNSKDDDGRGELSPSYCTFHLIFAPALALSYLIQKIHQTCRRRASCRARCISNRTYISKPLPPHLPVCRYRAPTRRGMCSQFSTYAKESHPSLSKSNAVSEDAFVALPLLSDTTYR